MTRILRSLKPGRSAVAALLVVLVAFGAWTLLGDAGNTTIRARFTSAEGLNVGDDVRVLGVSVGRITAIKNDGDGVLVTMKVDAHQPVPADAHAAIVSPSLVSGRFIQLAPVWDGGDRLHDGDTIGVDRTAVPITFDEVKEQLTDLATTLGPGHGRKAGALAATITSLDRSLARGNSGRLRSAITELHGAAQALSDGRSDLFGTIDNLNRFTRNLALKDAAVRGFTQELSAVGGVLATNRSTLRGAVRDLGAVLATTEHYLVRHRGRLVGTVRDLNLLTAALADRSNELAGILHLSPHALIGLHNAIENQGLTVRQSTTGLHDVPQLLCGVLLGVGGTSQACQDALAPVLDLLGLAPGETP